MEKQTLHISLLKPRGSLCQPRGRSTLVVCDSNSGDGLRSSDNYKADTEELVMHQKELMQSHVAGHWRPYLGMGIRENDGVHGV